MLDFFRWTKLQHYLTCCNAISRKETNNLSLNFFLTLSQSAMNKSPFALKWSITFRIGRRVVRYFMILGLFEIKEEAVGIISICYHKEGITLVTHPENMLRRVRVKFTFYCLTYNSFASKIIKGLMCYPENCNTFNHFSFIFTSSFLV